MRIDSIQPRRAGRGGVLLFIIFFLTCHGPDIGSSWPQKKSAAGEKPSLPPLSMPVIIYPPSGYQTTSNILLIRAGTSPDAVKYKFEALSGSTVVATQDLAAANINGLLTLPIATYGTFAVRLSYQTSDGRQSAWTSVDASVRDFNAGTLVKNITYASRATCAVCTIFIVFPCPGWNWPLTCPGGANNNLANCDTDSYQGGGNGWICGDDPNEDYLGVNNSNSGAYLPANAGYNYDWLDSSMISSSYQENHVSGTSDEAIIFTCRMKFAAQCPGNDAGTSFFFYPYRDPATSDNIEIRQRNCTGTWASLAAGRISTNARRRSAPSSTTPARRW